LIKIPLKIPVQEFLKEFLSTLDRDSCKNFESKSIDGYGVRR